MATLPPMMTYDMDNYRLPPGRTRVQTSDMVNPLDLPELLWNFENIKMNAQLPTSMTGESFNVLDHMTEQVGGNPVRYDYGKYRNPMVKEKFEVERMVDAYNKRQLNHWDTDKKEQLLNLAAKHNIEVDREGKPFKKMAFDAVDWSLFGLVPDKWRPYAEGDEHFGETGGDKVAGWTGTIGGLVGGGLLLTKGGSLALGGLGRAGLWGLNAIKGTQIGSKVATGTTKGLNYLNKGKNTVLSYPGQKMGLGTSTYGTKVGQYQIDPYASYGQAGTAPNFFNMAAGF